MDRRELIKSLAIATAGAAPARALTAQQSASPMIPRPEFDPLAPRTHSTEDTWPGKKRLLAIADADIWYNRTRNSYHHDASSHTLAVIERLGRESGDWITVIRTDFKLFTKDINYGRNARTLNDFDAIFYMGGGPWDITDEQKSDILAFVHEDGKGFVAGHASNGGGCILWREYAEMIGGDLIGEFPSATMPMIIEDPKFPGMERIPAHWEFRDQYTILGANFSRNVDHVIMRMDSSRFAEKLASLNAEKDGSHLSQEAYVARFRQLMGLRTDGDYPVVWARKYGKGRVWYSTFGHLEVTLDDPHVQEMYTGGIRWALGLADSPLKPHPYTGKPFP